MSRGPNSEELTTLNVVATDTNSSAASDPFSHDVPEPTAPGAAVPLDLPSRAGTTASFAEKPQTPGSISRQLTKISHADTSIDLSWEGIRYTVKTPEGPKELLKGLQGTARAGRVLVIMGPSGAGKSTLLNALSGRLKLDRDTALEGVMCLNDAVFDSKHKRLMSFVAQDDIIMPKETPVDAFHFALAMKETKRTPQEDEELVNGLLEKLRLVECKDTIMGVPGVLKGVSGGEKKRTNIGTELITNPPIMLLDEPTSGLDSVSALRIGHLMCDLAHDEGRTVVCTLHTPSSELFQVFDDLMLMAKGHIIYHGPLDGAKAFFASIGMPVPPRVNPSEYYMRLLQSDATVVDGMAASWKAYAAQQMEKKQNYSVLPVPPVIHETNATLDKLVAERVQSHPAKQLRALCGRSWRNTIRDPMLFGNRFFQILFFGFLIGLLYINLADDDAGVQDREGLLYIICIQSSMMSLFPALLTFPAERPVFIQDMTNDLYSAHMYYWSKVVVEFPIQIAVPTLYSIIVYFMSDLTRTPQQFFIFLLLVIILSYTAQAFGMLLSAAFEKAQMSLALGPLILMPIMLVAGLLANTERLEPGWVWLEYMSFVRFTYKGLILNEFEHLPHLAGPKFLTGEAVIELLGFTKSTDRWQVDVGANIGYMLFFRVAGSFALYWHGRQTQNRLPYADNFHKMTRTVVARNAVMGK